MIVYSTDNALDSLEMSPVAFFDGTFKIAPRHFRQIFIVRVIVNDVTIPAVYAFLEDKSFKSYSLALKIIKRARPEWCPAKIISDFETPELQALEEHFGQTCQFIKGCNFHFNQAVLKHFKKVPGFSDNFDLRECLYLCYGLPFVPPSDVPFAWEHIKGRLRTEHPLVCETFIKYFTDTWMDGLYSVELWNCYQRTLDGDPRTNNVSEGGNHAINVAFGVERPVFWKCVEKLREFQNETDCAIVQSITGRRRVVPKRRDRVRREERRVAYVRDYSNMSIHQYLRNHCLLSGAR